MSLISEAAREELEVLALHGEAALVGVRRRGDEDDVTVGILAAGERLDDAALAGERRVRGRVREGEGDGVADFDNSYKYSYISVYVMHSRIVPDIAKDRGRSNIRQLGYINIDS